MAADSQNTPEARSHSRGPDVDKTRLLSVLVREFGGQARCVDLASRLLASTGRTHIQDQLVSRVRRLLVELDRLGLVVTEQIGESDVLADITPQGADLDFRNSFLAG